MNKIKQKMEETETSYYKLGQVLGCSPTAAEYKAKTKDYKSTIEELEKMAKLFNCKIEDLI